MVRPVREVSLRLRPPERGFALLTTCDLTLEEKLRCRRCSVSCVLGVVQESKAAEMSQSLVCPLPSLPSSLHFPCPF